MRTNLIYKVSVECEEFPCYDDCFIHEHNVDVSCQDIVEYLFYEKYRKHWNPLNWHLEEGAKEFVKDIEDSWLRNEIDEYGLLHDLNMQEFLKEKYKDEVEESCRLNQINYIRDCCPEYEGGLEVYCEVR